MNQMQDAASAAKVTAYRGAPSAELSGYREQYPLKPMAKKEDNADQLVLMVENDGLSDMPSAPAASAAYPQVKSPPATFAEAPTNRHLWAIRAADMPLALEACEWGKQLESGCIKHSNLTGGLEAHSGGEMWFIAEDRIAVNASSGRYGAQSEKEFDLIVDALRSSGYHVASSGFDIDNNTVANKIFIGEPEWKAPL